MKLKKRSPTPEATLTPASPPGDGPRSEARSWMRERRARVLLCVSGVSFMIMLDSNIVAVSLPSIARDLHAAFADVEWVVSAYVLTFAAFLLPAGALADRFGRRRLLIAGVTLFTLASLLCGLAPTPVLLNCARAAQGVGAALQLSAALAVLGHEFRGGERARAFAFWGTVIGIAVAAGPVVGGIITSAFGWRWAFLVNVPFGVCLIALGVAAVEESSDPHAQQVDLPGMLLFGVGLFCLVWTMIDANVDGWTAAATVIKLCAGVVLLFLFVIAERMQKSPMVDLDLFRDSTFLGSSFAMLGFAAAAQVMMTFLPLYLQNAYGLTPVSAGLAMLPFALPLFFFPRVAGALAARISGRTLLTIGLAVVACGNLATAAAIGGGLHYPIVAIGMALTGCGAGLLNGETAKVQISVVPPERGGVVSGISATTRFVGLVTGIAGLGAVLTGETAKHLVSASVATLTEPTGIRALVSRIVAGDVANAVSRIDPGARQALLALARQSFAAGFTVVLLAAAAIAAIAGLLTLIFVRAVDTAPVGIKGD